MPYTPDTTISWNTLVDVGRSEHGLKLTTRESGDFLGASGGGYPHFHVWRKQPRRIAISVGANVNYSVGQGGDVNIEELRFAMDRGISPGGVNDLIAWVLSSAS